MKNFKQLMITYSIIFQNQENCDNTTVKCHLNDYNKSSYIMLYYSIEWKIIPRHIEPNLNVSTYLWFTIVKGDWVLFRPPPIYPLRT